MTIEEQKTVLKAVADNHFCAGMMKMDAICYGGDAAKYGRDERYAEAIIASFPKDIVEAYNASLRKVEADKLRWKADAIERGEAQPDS